MSTNSNRTVTINGWFAGLLTLLFIGLKLTGHIGWSWWWVLAPMWIPLAIVLVILLFVGIYICIKYHKEKVK